MSVQSPTEVLLGQLERLVDALPAAEGPAFLGDLERLKARLWIRLLGDRPIAPAPASANEDRLLSATAAAPILGVKPRWLYEHAQEIPGMTRLGRHIRFSERKLRRWLEKRST